MRLKELRKARKLKQTEIAEMLSCSQGVYSRYESGEREPPFDIIKKLAEIYGVTIDYLMGGNEPNDEIHTKETVVTDKPDMRSEAKKLLESMTDEQYQAALQYLKFLKSQK